MENKIKEAEILTEALPYINKFKDAYFLIKFGGSIMENEESKKLFCRQIALLKSVGIHPIVVHGGGKEITRWLNKIGKEAVFIDGLRVTDSETIEILEMVLSGKIRNDLVSTINSFGVKAIGLSGKDVSLFTCKKITERSDLGFVGEVIDVNSEFIKFISKSGIVPVISSVGFSSERETLNINADTVASKVASSLEVEKLILLTDVDGLKIENKLIKKITLSEANKLLTHPEVTGGMIPKLQGCINAISDGVKNIHLVNGNIPYSILLEVFTDGGIGTMITNS